MEPNRGDLDRKEYPVMDKVPEGIVDALTYSVLEKALGHDSKAKHDPEVYALRKQLSQVCRVNQSLCDYLKEVHGLNEEQVLQAQRYKPAKKKVPSQCPNCGQRVFSRNISTCKRCGGNLPS